MSHGSTADSGHTVRTHPSSGDESEEPFLICGVVAGTLDGAAGTFLTILSQLTLFSKMGSYYWMYFPLLPPQPRTECYLISVHLILNTRLC